jgi:tetratricopeptide (TPR) repeat protein
MVWRFLKKYQYQIRIPESVYIRYSNFLSRQGKGDEALEITKKYVQEYPQSSFAHFYLGARYERLGEFNLAIDNFKKAIEMEKKTLLPESEKLIVYRINLQEVEEKGSSLMKR